MIDKHGETIASAITNLDLHDIARACRTYGVKGYYVITPLTDQQVLAKRILDHWIAGRGGVYNPQRRQALELVRIKASYAQTVEDIASLEGCRPQTVATTARRLSGNLTYQGLKDKLTEASPLVLAFGTAWGLSEQFMADADWVLDALIGAGAYNHLSVRSAVSIILDRLLGDRS